MKKLYSLSIALLMLSTAMYGKNPETNAALKARAAQWVQNQPVIFMENKGQFTDMDGTPVPFALFKAEAPGMNLFITDKGLTYVFFKTEEECEKENQDVSVVRKGREAHENRKMKYARIEMTLRDAVIKKENIIRSKPSQGEFNFYLGHCPDGILGVKEYEEITIKEAYPGIDWVLHNSDSKGFEHDFVVHPGADPKQIELVYSSLNPLHLSKDGQIEIETQLGLLTEHAPVSFQDDASAKGKHEIKTSFTKNSSIKNNKGGYDTHIQFFCR